jgi:hypothetical protein
MAHRFHKSPSHVIITTVASHEQHTTLVAKNITAQDQLMGIAQV